MKTDRELLELSAKAASIDLIWPISKAGDQLPWDVSDESNHRMWNPLNDDGDALRLAIKLGISFCRNDWFVFANMYSDPSETDQSWAYSEKFRDDPCPAARRAIVRAAADIGEKIK